MTATERLRELLDERGVEWTSGSTEVSRDKYTDFCPDSGIVVGVWERGDGKLGIDAHTTYRFTPEQAIAATLGRGELVRCKDCASFIRDATPHDDDRPHFCTKLGVDLADGDGFCAWGVRKEDA